MRVGIEWPEYKLDEIECQVLFLIVIDAKERSP
jgi:hypothetical protein